jgi:predicted chitinase
METYIVRSGDTLSSIAARHGMPFKDLLQANPQIKDPDSIHPGEPINIPDHDTAARQTQGATPTLEITPASAGFASLTAQQLCAIVPDLSPTKAAMLIECINQAMREAHISTPARQAAFLAQIAHETGGFRWFHELGADESFRKYEGREDLGNTEPGDGARYKGRGFIQVTGRANYTKAGEALGLDLVHEPQLAETPSVGARVAAYFWQSHGFNALADKGDFITITRRINGGLTGLEERQAYYERAKGVLEIA